MISAATISQVILDSLRVLTKLLPLLSQFNQLEAKILIKTSNQVHLRESSLIAIFRRQLSKKWQAQSSRRNHQARTLQLTQERILETLEQQSKKLSPQENHLLVSSQNIIPSRKNSGLLSRK